MLTAAPESYRGVNIRVNPIDIVNDIAWQLEAYRHGGLAEIKQICDNERDSIHNPAGIKAIWTEIDSGVQQGDQAKILSGNLALLHREQWETLADGYANLSTDYFLTSGMMSLLAQNSVWGPIPLINRPFLFGDFETVVPLGYLPFPDDRWEWITSNPTGIWPAWTSRFDWDKSFQVKVWLRVRAYTYSFAGFIW